MIDHTHTMLAYVQCLLMAAAVSDPTVDPALVERLTRIEAYLIERYARD